MSGWNEQEMKLVTEMHRLLQEYHSRHNGEFQAQHAVFAEVLFRAGVITEAQRNTIFEIVNSGQV